MRITLKEKSEVFQYEALLASKAPAANEVKVFTFPLITFGGNAPRDSMLLYDESTPTTQVVYTLEIFFKWNGRIRKSAIIDWTVLRPQDMDFAVISVALPVPSNTVPTALIRYRLNDTLFAFNVDDDGNIYTTPA